MTSEQHREYHREVNRRYRERHRERLKAEGVARRATWGPEKKRQRADAMRALRLSNTAYADRDRARANEWNDTHRERRRANAERLYYESESFRIGFLLRCNLHRAITRHKSGRDWRPDAKLRAILDCSKPDLIAHIEAQFLPGMSWANYGRKGWEIDHIKPCASFDLTQHDQVLLCFHYTNLRPLWRLDNLRRPRKE